MSHPNEQVRELLEKFVREQGEIGLQTAAYLDGELAIDTWAGFADESTRRPVDGNTLFTAFSVSKGITATCIHILADRGLLDYEAPIARYWPEFGIRGKSEATIRHALTHQAGIPKDPPEMDITMMCDWEAVTRATAELEALSKPGTRIDYHALTYGWILGEIVRRIDGRPISVFLQEEICTPLKISDLYMGIPKSQEHRAATLVNEPDLEVHKQDFDIADAHPLSDTAKTFNRSDVRSASIPAAGVIVNARSLARHYAMLADGGELEGVRIISKEGLDRVLKPIPEDTQETGVRWWTRHCLGYTLGGGPGPREGRPNAFGYEGTGTIGFADPDRRFAFAFLLNMVDLSPIDENSIVTHVCREVEKALGID
jgi:CubicO group peptidase (beta-lactamase class C family)